VEVEWVEGAGGVVKCQVSSVKGEQIDQLFLNGVRLPMARYPNFDPDKRPYNGFAADAFSRERAARWKDPAGGYIHAMHRAHWGGYHYRITGKDAKGDVTYEGGWQNNRQMGMHPEHRFVENIFEELDAPGEWFHDAKSGILHLVPPVGTDVSTSVVEVVRLRHLVEFNGTKERPVRFVTLKGLVFRHAARTFMDTKEPLLRSDWTIYRGGAVLFNGAEDCSVTDCEFDQLGGNAVFVSKYNRRIAVRRCHIHDTGASAVAFVGSPDAVRNPLFEYGQRQDYAVIDRTPGPKTDDFPADCMVEDCLIVKAGVVEKQATGVQISMSQGITVRHCSIYDMSRAGINISEGTFGGHLIEFCDVFDTVKETGDHGCFNSWGRDRFWGLQNAPPEELPQLSLLDAVKPSVLRNSRWRCDHGWDVDLDDGSSNYEIYNNVFLAGGLKLREGFHRRVWNNIAVNNTLHPHVWFDNCMDVVTNNIWMAAYRPAGGMPKGKWGREIDRNFFTQETDKTRFAANGCDGHSVVGDPMFVDPAKGDYQVKEGSPALAMGFVNFPMDQFGVHKPSLKAIARTPELALPNIAGREVGAVSHAGSSRVGGWEGGRVKDLDGEEYSAFGVSRESGGVHLVAVPAGSPLAKAGLRDNDLLQGANGQPVRRFDDLLHAMSKAGGKPVRLAVIREQKPLEIALSDYAWAATSTAEGPGAIPAPAPQVGTVAAVRSVGTQPATNNEQPTTLHDGRLAPNYGPVFPNGVRQGMYKVDLGELTEIAAVVTWSHNQNGNRGAQRFALYGSAASSDPGWNVGDTNQFASIAEVATPSAGFYTATTLRRSKGASMGSYRWLVWAVEPVTGLPENTAFQELQILRP